MNQGGYGGGTAGGDYSYGGGGYADQSQQQQLYNNNNPYASSNNVNNEHQHQQYYQHQDDQQQYYPAANDGYYGGDEDQHQLYDAQYDDTQQYGGEYTDNYMNDDEGQHVDPNSPFYPTNAPFVPHPNDTPDSYGNYNTQGDPISAIAVDLEGEISNNSSTSTSTLAPALLYVASHTSVQREKRTGLQHPANAGQIRTRTTRNKDFTLDRGSRLSVLYNDNTSTVGSSNDENINSGGKTLYSTFVAHPEASPKILNGLHSILYNGAVPLETTNSSTGASSSSISRGLGGSSSTLAKARPSHAYGPPYGPASYTHHCSTNLFSAILSNNNNTYRPEDKYCLGISSIFSVSTPYFGSGGRICTISPYGVRIHTRGGMIMSSKCDLLQGMICGQLVHGTTCANVCGISYNSDTTTTNTEDTTAAQQRAQHVHCIDLNRDCKIVSSHTLVRTPKPGEDSSGGGGGTLMCVTDMATNHERNNIVVGCSDGTVRVLDGGRRNAEVAKAKGQTGGVAKVDVMENLIVASGYSNPGVSSPSSPLPYPFPAPHVLIYDVRYLGRGGVSRETFFVCILVSSRCTINLHFIASSYRYHT